MGRLTGLCLRVHSRARLDLLGGGAASLPPLGGDRKIDRGYTLIIERGRHSGGGWKNDK